ncbi:hypothetical protein KIPB_006563 [Kipferlia bialata]|uniref:Uncharacterized protein n=1 Tax=Kipferlia bialata TaxID=797122 RepID=A0A9K3D0E8_9EUKA|nr:hypothetical protein KIPB_006563 [Kipferlia bialata]|eukprot:g6563.t1
MSSGSCLKRVSIADLLPGATGDVPLPFTLHRYALDNGASSQPSLVLCDVVPLADVLAANAPGKEGDQFVPEKERKKVREYYQKQYNASNARYTGSLEYVLQERETGGCIRTEKSYYGRPGEKVRVSPWPVGVGEQEKRTHKNKESPAHLFRYHVDTDQWSMPRRGVSDDVDVQYIQAMFVRDGDLVIQGIGKGMHKAVLFDIADETWQRVNWKSVGSKVTHEMSPDFSDQDEYEEYYYSRNRDLSRAHQATATAVLDERLYILRTCLRAEGPLFHAEVDGDSRITFIKPTSPIPNVNGPDRQRYGLPWSKAAIPTDQGILFFATESSPGSRCTKTVMYALDPVSHEETPVCYTEYGLVIHHD